MRTHLIRNPTMPRYTSQRGVVLIYALMVLFILMVLAAPTMEMIVSGEKVASNYQDQAIAHQKAEAAISTGEEWLLTVDGTIDVGANLVDGSGGTQPMVWGLGSESPDSGDVGSENSTWITQHDDEWWEDRALALNGHDDTYYFTEFVAFARDSLAQDGNFGNQAAGDYYYRITAKAHGESTSNVVLQTVYLRKVD